MFSLFIEIMEELKSSVRPYDTSFQYKQSLKGPPLYYRISVNSQMTTTPITDAVFDVRQVFPNQRADMMRGEWHAFLESFETVIPSQLGKSNIKVCLPDLVRSSQDFVMTSNGANIQCQVNDAIGHVPIVQEFRSLGVATYNVPAITLDPNVDANDPTYGTHSVRAAYAVPAVPVDYLAAKPIALHATISADSIGVKIDPVSLFSGQLRVLLRDEHHTPLVAGDQAGQLNANSEGWRATILFVHKA